MRQTANRPYCAEVKASSLSRGELGGSCETVDGEGVAQVVCQVLNWSLACHDGLDKETQHGEHGLQQNVFCSQCR